MMDEWIKAADGFILIFAINDEESFEALKQKVNRIKKNNKSQFPIVIAGNKCDLHNKRQVNQQNAMEYAKSIGAKYYETSALLDENGNCKVIFQQCAHLIVSGDTISEKSGTCCSIW